MAYPPVSLKLIVLMSSYGPCINDICSYHRIPENLHLFIIAAQIILRAVILTCFPFLPLCKNPLRWTFWWSVHSKCFRWLCRNLRETFHASVKIFMHTHGVSSAIDIAPCAQIKFVEIVESWICCWYAVGCSLGRPRQRPLETRHTHTVWILMAGLHNI